MVIYPNKKELFEYSVSWTQSRPGEIALKGTKIRAEFLAPIHYSETARLANDGLEVFSGGHYAQFYRLGSPQLGSKIADMRRAMNPSGGGNDALGQLLGQVVSAAASGGVNTLVNNPRATLSDVKHGEEEGALNSLQQ